MLEILLAATVSAAMTAAPASPSALPGAGDASTQMILSGPVIAGVCVLSPDTVVSGSKVGQAANVRFEQLAKQTQQELQAEQVALQTKAHALDGAKTPAIPQQRATLAAEGAALQKKVEQRNRELELTRVKVVQRISQQVQPLIASAYSAHHCGLLFRREQMLAGNPTNDLTPEIVQALDRKITTLTFDREQLPAAGPGAPAN